MGWETSLCSLRVQQSLSCPTVPELRRHWHGCSSGQDPYNKLQKPREWGLIADCQVCNATLAPEAADGVQKARKSLLSIQKWLQQHVPVNYWELKSPKSCRKAAWGTKNVGRLITKVVSLSTKKFDQRSQKGEALTAKLKGSPICFQ